MNKDYFSSHAQQYATFRPTYPNDLFDFLFSKVALFNRAWDCGTGNGQTALVLAQRFTRVDATDISQLQLQEAPKHPIINYSVCPAEQTLFKDFAFDLITVSQALHWFNLDLFYKEVNRVLSPQGIIAVWGYSLLRVNPGVDKILDDFYRTTVGPYWDDARKYVDEEYKNILFPFQEIQAPRFSMTFHWSFDQLIGYINTWSAVKKFIQERKINPVDELAEKIKPFYGTSNTIVFPLFMRIGKTKSIF
jgi:SAM-dependent methyltransferase